MNETAVNIKNWLVGLGYTDATPIKMRLYRTENLYLDLYGAKYTDNGASVFYVAGNIRYVKRKDRYVFTTWHNGVLQNEEVYVAGYSNKNTLKNPHADYYHPFGHSMIFRFWPSNIGSIDADGYHTRLKLEIEDLPIDN